MRAVMLLAAGLLAGILPFAAVQAGGDAAAGAEKAAGCKGCHNAMVNLNGRGADVIAAQTRAIRAGEKAHPPGIAGLCDEDIADIAAYLDGA